tara:strand:+ start:810 stop:923 length:114 start_codon:yes stop_codon:yes gene_type:complete
MIKHRFSNKERSHDRKQSFKERVNCNQGKATAGDEHG